MKPLANKTQNNINMKWELGFLAWEEEASISYTGLRFLLFIAYLLQEWKTLKYKEQLNSR